MRSCNCLLKPLFCHLRTSQNFLVIVDGTQDVSSKEQLLICLRYVDDKFVPHEEFIGLYEPRRTTGSVTADCIKDVFIQFNLPLSMLSGQTYDGANNMSGEYRGCQAIITDIQLLAIYVHFESIVVAMCTNNAFNFVLKGLFQLELKNALRKKLKKQRGRPTL